MQKIFVCVFIFLFCT